MLLAGAPVEDRTTITNPVLSPNLQDILVNSIPETFFKLFIPRMIGLVFVIGAIIFFFVMMIGAIQWIISGGDKAAIEAARGKIVNAIVGLIILFSTFALLKIIEDFFGINILVLDIGALQIQ